MNFKIQGSLSSRRKFLEGIGEAKDLQTKGSQPGTLLSKDGFRRRNRMALSDGR